MLRFWGSSITRAIVSHSDNVSAPTPSLTIGLLSRSLEREETRSLPAPGLISADRMSRSGRSAALPAEARRVTLREVCLRERRHPVC